MQIRHKLLVFTAVGIGLLLPSTAMADESWHISRSHTTLQAKHDGETLVKERIEADFGQHERAVISRRIPLRYEWDGSVYFVRIEIDEVLRNGVEEPYQVQLHHDYAEVMIGDERLMLTGPQEYQISYHIDGAYRNGKTNDKLVLQAVGGWDPDITQATASIELPVDTVSAAECYVRRSDGHQHDDRCQSAALDGGKVSYSATQGIPAGGQMLIAALYESGSIPIARVQPPSLVDWIEVYRVPLLWLSALSATSLLIAGSLWLLRRKAINKLKQQQ